MAFTNEQLDQLEAERKAEREAASLASMSEALSELDLAYECTFEIRCDTILDHYGDLDPAKAEFVPDDGVILIPSTIMTIAENKSANANIEACEAVTKWMLSEAGQEYILDGYMHSVLKGMPCPYDSVDTDELMKKDIGVDWDRCYHQRDEIRTKFEEAVTIAK